MVTYSIYQVATLNKLYTRVASRIYDPTPEEEDIAIGSPGEPPIAADAGKSYTGALSSDTATTTVLLQWCSIMVGLVLSAEFSGIGIMFVFARMVRLGICRWAQPQQQVWFYWFYYGQQPSQKKEKIPLCIVNNNINNNNTRDVYWNY